MKLSTILANAAIITGSLVSAELDSIVVKVSYPVCLFRWHPPLMPLGNM